MIVKNLLMIPASSVAGIFMLFVTCSLFIPGSSEKNSTIISTIAQIIPHKVSNDNGTVDSSHVIKSQIELKTHTTVSLISELENYINLTHQRNCQLNNITRKHYDLVTKLSLEITKLNTNLSQQQEKILKFMKDNMELNYHYMELNKSHSIDKQNIKTINENLKSLQLHNHDMENYLAKEKENNKILFDANTLLDNKLSASLLENKGLNNQLLQLNDTCKKISRDKEQTLAEYSEVHKKYTKTLENLLTCDNRLLSSYDHQVESKKNLTTLELKIKDIIHEKDHTKEEMQRIIDSSQLEISLKTQQYSNISLELKNKVDENKKMIQESIALKKEEAEKLKAIEYEYQLNLTNKQQEDKILKEIIVKISPKDLVELLDLLKILISIMEFNEDSVPYDLLEKRRQLFENKYNENQTVVVDDLRKRFDDIALTSDSKYCNKYFCNKKISFYNSTLCAMISENANIYEVDFRHRNWAVLPKDIFTGFENHTALGLSSNRLEYLESGTFNNLSNLMILDIKYNKLKAIPRDIFNGLGNLRELNLRYNQLNSLQSGTFNNLSNLKKLFLHKNHLTSLPKDIFCGLKNLDWLTISANRLTYLESSTFNGLSQLIRLNLGENDLTTLPKDIFKGLENLRFLDLQSNKLNFLESDVFNNLPKLGKLSISIDNLTIYLKYILKNKYNFEFFRVSYPTESSSEVLFCFEELGLLKKYLSDNRNENFKLQPSDCVGYVPKITRKPGSGAVDQKI